MFMSGLIDDPTQLVEHCYEMYIERKVNMYQTGTYTDKIAERKLKAEGKNKNDMSLFDSLYKESRVQLPGRPLHNQYINYYNHLYAEHTTPVYKPSQYYRFVGMEKDVVLEEVQGTEISECAMRVMNPDESVTKSLLKTCHMISEHQAVTDLEMHDVRCESSTAEELPLIRAHARSARLVNLIRCALPMSYLRHILHQLSQSVDTLQFLNLEDMDLKLIETELDELLEWLVSHHESGKAQSKLILTIVGSEEEPTNLSQDFVDKWTRLCKGIESITPCDIGDIF